MRQDSLERETPARPTRARECRHWSNLGGDREPCNEWCRLGGRPWYDQGWLWALLSVAGLALVAWQLGAIHQALEASAEATRQQTGGMAEQAQVMRAWAVVLDQQAARVHDRALWLLEQLRAVGRAIAALGEHLRESLPVFRSG